MKQYKVTESGIELQVEVPEVTHGDRRITLRMTIVNRRNHNISFYAFGTCPTSHADVKVKGSDVAPRLLPAGENILGPSQLRIGSGGTVTLEPGKHKSWELYLSNYYELSPATYVMRLNTEIACEADAQPTVVTVEGITFKVVK